MESEPRDIKDADNAQDQSSRQDRIAKIISIIYPCFPNHSLFSLNFANKVGVIGLTHYRSPTNKVSITPLVDEAFARIMAATLLIL